MNSVLKENTRSWSWNLHFDLKVKLVFSHNLFTTDTLSGRGKASLPFK